MCMSKYLKKHMCPQKVTSSNPVNFYAYENIWFHSTFIHAKHNSPC